LGHKPAKAGAGAATAENRRNVGLLSPTVCELNQVVSETGSGDGWITVGKGFGPENPRQLIPGRRQVPKTARYGSVRKIDRAKALV